MRCKSWIDVSGVPTFCEMEDGHIEVHHGRLIASELWWRHFRGSDE